MIKKRADGQADKGIQESLTTNLTRIICEPVSLYTSNRFSGIFLSEQTIRLRDEVPTGLQLGALNRRLLEATFPNALRPMREDEFVLVHAIQRSAKTRRFLEIDAELQAELLKTFGTSLRTNSFDYRIP